MASKIKPTDCYGTLCLHRKAYLPEPKSGKDNLSIAFSLYNTTGVPSPQQTLNNVYNLAINWNDERITTIEIKYLCISNQ